MTLDGYSYLTSYGWSGRGTGLRNGAIDKPIAIPQKRNLAGVGKDRDEAFPFWDHLFTAASKAITIKVTSDEVEQSGVEVEEEVPFKNQLLDLKRTCTGIISNRRPTSGTPVSGDHLNTSSQLSLIAAAKREAVKRGLYSRFFRGPVLGPDIDSSTSVTPTTSSSPAPESSSREVKRKRRKSKDRVETKEERRERKRLKRERKEAKALEKPAQKEASESCPEDYADEEIRKSAMTRERQLSDPGEYPSQDPKRRSKDLATETIPGKPKRKKGSGERTTETHDDDDSSFSRDLSIPLNSKTKKGKRKQATETSRSALTLGEDEERISRIPVVQSGFST